MMRALLPILFVAVTFPDLAAQGLRQGIMGEVLWLGGNQMPGPGKAQDPALGVKRDVYIYKVLTLREMNGNGPLFPSVPAEPVARTESKSNGAFKVKLPPGEYSVFVKEPGGFFANLFNEQGQINHITVKEKEYTWITIVVDHAAVF